MKTAVAYDHQITRFTIQAGLKTMHTYLHVLNVTGVHIKIVLVPRSAPTDILKDYV